MSDFLQELVPAEWRGAFAVAVAPIAWLPELHVRLMTLAWYGDSAIEVVAKRSLLLLPILLLLAGLWCTMASAYTLPFRAERNHFLRTFGPRVVGRGT